MPRPMTHDLMKDALEALDVDIERVVVTELRASTYFAELHLRRGADRASGPAGPPTRSPWPSGPGARSTSPTS